MEYEISNLYTDKIKFLGFCNLSNEKLVKYIKSDDNLYKNTLFKNETLLFFGIKIDTKFYLIPFDDKEYITKKGYKKGQTFYNLYNKNKEYLKTLRISLMFPILEKDLDIIEENNFYLGLKDIILNDKEQIKEKISNIYSIGKKETNNPNLIDLVSNYTYLETVLYLDNVKNTIVDKSIKIKGILKTKVSNKLDYLHKRIREKKSNKIKEFKEDNRE